MNGFTRRGFLGTLFAAPAAVVVIGEVGQPELQPFPTRPVIEEPVEFLTDAAASQTISAKRFAGAVFRVVDRRLSGTRVVGPKEAHVGTCWGSGTFTNQLCASTVLPVSSDGTLVYDRVLIESIGTQLADHIAQKGLKYFGRLPLPYGIRDVVPVENSRLSLRFVTQYHWPTDELLARFDVLGNPA